MSNALIIFVKNPEAGKVKTRLAADIGPDKALEVYLQLLEITKLAATQVKASSYVYYSHYIPEQDLWSGLGFEKRLQAASTDLGIRMYSALHEVLAHHQKVVIIGSDCPDISAEIIEQAFVSLNDYDAVVGPAVDGGYYLLGLCKAHKKLFEHKEWSTSSVLKDTLADMQGLKMTYSLLPQLTDIDTAADMRTANWLI